MLNILNYTKSALLNQRTNTKLVAGISTALILTAYETAVPLLYEPAISYFTLTTHKYNRLKENVKSKIKIFHYNDKD